MNRKVKVARRRQGNSQPNVEAGFFGPDADRRFGADRAHRGDIEGALGVVVATDTGPRRGVARRLTTLLAVMGPGLVVMVADNDAGGISTYAQAGQNYGLHFVWLLVLLAPVLYVNQEMVCRLGAVTGAGHARLIVERFGRRWGAFALGDLLVLNFLTIVTEFVGVLLSLSYFGISRYLSVPCAAALLIGAAATGSFRLWERAMYACITVSFLAIPLLIFSRAGRHSASTTLLSSSTGHPSEMLFVIALIGTTVAPWQLFFQQSNVVDKRVAARFLGYERVDTAIGTILFVVSAIAVLLACAIAFDGTSLHGAFTDAGALARELRSRIGPLEGSLFAIILFDGSVLGAGAVTLSTSYAVGDFFGLRHSLHRRWTDAPTFYNTYAGCVLVAAAVVLVPGLPLGLVTTVVQALAGVLLPSATMFLLLLCNDRAVLGPWVNPRWLNVVASMIVGVLLVLSALLTLTTAFRNLPVAVTAVVLVTVITVVAAGVRLATRKTRIDRIPPTYDNPGIWTMPVLESLDKPESSSGRTLGLVVLRSYLLIAVVLLIVRAVQLAIGS